MSQPQDQAARARFLASLDRGPGTVWRHELDGGVIAEGTTRGPKAHGPYREWFPNGQVRLERGYYDNKLNGACRQFSPDGRLLAEFIMTGGDGILLEHWDNGSLKLRWLQFHVEEKPCAAREYFDIHGEHPTRDYLWKGGACRTKKRFVAELAKYGLVLPPAEKRYDAAVWAEFAGAARVAKR